MAEQWFYGEGENQCGPVSRDELLGLIAQGIVGDLDLVWREGMAEWKPLAAVSELQGDGVIAPANTMRSANKAIATRGGDVADARQQRGAAGLARLARDVGPFEKMGSGVSYKGGGQFVGGKVVGSPSAIYILKGHKNNHGAGVGGDCGRADCRGVIEAG